MHDRLPANWVFRDTRHELFKVWKISEISETVQDRDIFTMDD